MTLQPPAALDRAWHRAEEFRSGQLKLDTWLRASAGQAERRDASRTYVLADDAGRIVAFYTLVAGQLDAVGATLDVRHGMSKHSPIPVVILARLAADERRHGEGIGAALLADAMRKAVRAAGVVGIRAVVVDAIDARAAEFYRRFGFEALEPASLTLKATVAQLRIATQS